MRIEENLMKIFAESLLRIAAVVCLAIPGLAQNNAGRLVGSVSSADGVVKGATVVITDNQTTKQRTVVASDEGTFTIPQLEVGIYTVKVTATGFKSYAANDVKIDVGREYSLNVTLEIGNIQESVTVTAGADVVNATSGELSNTVSPRQVLELPLNGRNPLSLVGLQPGAAPNRGNGSEIINGGRTSSTNFVRDGINVQDIFIRNGFVGDNPTVDNTGEFTVITQNSGADSGYGSSQIQLVTPRGASEFHGALFLYNRNSKLSANNFFSNAAGQFNAADAAVQQGRARVGDDRQPRAFLNRNQFGGKIGGPMPVPRFGEGGPALSKGKGFFFFSYEKYILRQQTPKTTTIFLPNARNGIFSYRPTGTPAAGQCITFANGVCTVNVLSGVGMTGAIPAGLQGALPLDPLVQSRFLNQIPITGNRADLGDGLNTTGLGFNQSDPEDRKEFTTRIDVQLTEKHAIKGIYRFNRTVDARTDIDTTYNQSALANTNAPVKFGSFGVISSFSRFTNELNGGFNLAKVAFINDVLPNQPFLLGAVGTGTTALVTNPELNFRNQGRDTDTVAISDNASFSYGQHFLRFGGDTQRFKVRAFNQASVGIPTFNIAGVTNANTPRLTASLFPGGIGQNDLNNADTLRYLLGGVVGAGTIAANVTSRSATAYTPGAALDRNLVYNTYSGYVNDQWRILPQLTLNFGVRYEYYTPLRTTDGLYLEPVLTDDAVGSILNPTGTYDYVGRNSGKSGDFVKPDRNNFSPVVSFAYTPSFKNKLFTSVFGNEKTVLRAGFRMSYVNDEYIRSIDNAVGQNQGLSTTANAVQAGSPQLNARFGALPAIEPPAFLPIPRTFAQNNSAAFGNFGTIFAVDPKLQVSRQYEYNFSIQREIGYKMALEVRYVGAFSNQLARTIDYNQIDIRNNGFLADYNRAVQNERATRVGTTAGNINGTTACLASGACQPLTVIPNLTANGRTAVQTQITLGTPAETAFSLVSGGNAGGVNFLPNPNSGVVNLVVNSGRMRYNALQTELRRQLSEGLYFQANYTFQKILTDVTDDGINQSRVAPFLDNQNRSLDYARAAYDTTHIFNVNGLYELPIGRGKRFFDRGGVVDRIIGGWQITSIIQIASGPTLSILDPRGTLNRTGRSANQTANSSLSKDQIKHLIGVYKVDPGNAQGIPAGVYYINPSVIAPTGRAANGFGTANFTGQAFFNVDPGQTGNLERFFINGPLFWNWDASVIKNFRITESSRFQFRAEAFNLTNSTRFSLAPNPGILNINSTTFGRLTSASSPRIIQLVGRLEF
jgi:hypothetical protein